MIDATYVLTMARYNADMNRRLLSASGRLDPPMRRKNKGAFWGSIEGTLNHLLWADLVWMSRFENTEPVRGGLADSESFCSSFDELRQIRTVTDNRILTWAQSLDGEWLAGYCEWKSYLTGRKEAFPRALLVMHFFNHQAHHRGQAHALLTSFGEDTGHTDLWILAAKTE